MVLKAVPLAKATKEKVPLRMRGEHRKKISKQIKALQKKIEKITKKREEAAFKAGWQLNEFGQEEAPADTGLIVILVVQTALLALLGYLYCSGVIRILL